MNTQEVTNLHGPHGLTRIAMSSMTGARLVPPLCAQRIGTSVYVQDGGGHGQWCVASATIPEDAAPETVEAAKEWLLALACHRFDM